MNSMLKAPKIVVFALLFILCHSFSAQAKYEYKYDQKADPYGQFEAEGAAKLTRGATNVLFGWMEIFKTPIRMSEDSRSNAVKGVLLGVPYGVLRFVGRTVVGAYEVVTFYIPQEPIFSPIGGEVV